MNKFCKAFTFLSISLSVFAQTNSVNSTLPPLSEAREIGRAKSNLLTVKKETKTDVSGTPTANIDGFNKIISPVFKKNCIDCHGPKKAKGKFRVDELDPNLLTGKHIAKWVEVYEVLSNAEMPPDDEPDYHLGDKERSLVIDWLGNEMNKASLVRRNEGSHSSFRRMTKYEYNYALQDILGLPYYFVELLPPENVSEDGFKNSSDLLQMSASQFETYRQTGLMALQKATVKGEKPKEIAYVISMENEMAGLIKKAEAQAKKDEAKSADEKKKQKKNKGPVVFDSSDKNSQKRLHLFDEKADKGIKWSSGTYSPAKDAVAGQTPPVSSVKLVMNKNETLKLNLGNNIPNEGHLRVRIRAGRTSLNPNEYASLRLTISAHTSNNANFSAIISKEDIPVTAPADKPQFIEFQIPLTEIPRNPLRNEKGKGRMVDEYISIQNISNAGGKDRLKLHIDYIEISGPYYTEWPPKTHTAIFKDSKYKKDESKYSRDILRRFMGKAWRRPVSSQEIEAYASLFTEYRPQFDNFEDAMLEVLATLLASPEFLYIVQEDSSASAKGPKSISDIELANRLSIFLWSSIPDYELLNLAHEGKLKNPDVLKSQVNRMLADSRARRFAQNFVEQWLHLDGINAVNVDKKKFRSYYNDMFKEDILYEPVAFFDEVLKNNNSILDFIHSDYLVINDRLAGHYKIPGVYGQEFRKVAIDPKHNRGGILTGAAVLTMNSTGVDSHPLKRGIWLLENILHDPPPPPPPNVPQVDLTDPRILQMTQKERIADHRDNAACRSCHSKIDPWGIAFEGYDAIGNYRTKIEDKPVDAASVLFNKQKLDGMDGLKRYLLTERQDQFARAIVHKITSYALGRAISFSDRSEIDDMTVRLRKSGDGLKDLINIVVQSKLFHTK
ncbi:MAG: DUF1592 domain-containing protein [Lentisphaeraceae bacterium]|nr:DUF1592 domain-containing protein [Lentisphaeraceae bacterium]